MNRSDFAAMIAVEPRKAGVMYEKLTVQFQLNTFHSIRTGVEFGMLGYVTPDIQICGQS